jgi:hypothetical protein
MQRLPFLWLIISLLLCTFGWTQPGQIDLANHPYKIYPEVNELKPDLPSPFKNLDGNEYVIAATKANKFAIIPVTVSNNHAICQQLIIDTIDFPGLVKQGLHTNKQLSEIKTITGRLLSEITALGKPDGLSHAGFLAEDEDILSVIKADNEIVKKMGLTHPQLAWPVFHVLNMMDIDLALNRWNMAKHQWENIRYFFYNGQKVYVEAYDTKGGQKSIFNDGLEGAFHIKLWRELSDNEKQMLQTSYHSLDPDERDTFLSCLTTIDSGELQPQYIMRYGFYEGHTFWRADPIAIAFIFGIKTLSELETVFNHDLYRMLTAHFKEGQVNLNK